jgi:hypothetical protein
MAFFIASVATVATYPIVGHVSKNILIEREGIKYSGNRASCYTCYTLYTKVVSDEL